MEKIGRFKFIIGALILLTGVVLVLLQLSFKMNVLTNGRLIQMIILKVSWIQVLMMR